MEMINKWIFRLTQRILVVLMPSKIVQMISRVECHETLLGR